jgi:outer membrane protein TolC
MKPALLIFAFALWFLPAQAGEGELPTNSITLTQCFTEVLAHNDELARLRKDVERAVGTKIELRAADLAQINGELDGGIRGGSLYGHTSDYAFALANFSQPVFNTGILATWRRGQSEVLVAQQRLNVAVSDRLQEVRSYYLRAQRLGQLIAVSEEIIQRLEGNVTSEQQRREVGTSGPRPVLQAKVQLLAAQADLTAFRREAFEMQTRLAETMGRPMGQLPAVIGELPHETVAFDWSAQAQIALKRRADLKLLRALIKSAAEDKRIVDAGYFPYISLIASGLYIPGKKQVSQVTPIIQGQVALATEARYGGALTWQIVDNGSVTGASRQVAAVRQEYEISLRQLEQNIPRELARIGHSIEDANAQLTALNQSVTESAEQVRLVESRISVGQATQLDFSDAQRNLLAVRQGVVDALFQYDTALADLDGVTGRYLEFAEPPAKQ